MLQKLHFLRVFLDHRQASSWCGYWVLMKDGSLERRLSHLVGCMHDPGIHTDLGPLDPGWIWSISPGSWLLLGTA